MNVSKSYQPFGSQSRVDFIRRKFENSFSEENESGSLKRTSSAIPCKSNFFPEIKSLNAKKKVKEKTESNLKNSSSGKTEVRALVKRSPAFRRDKLGSTRSLTHIASNDSVSEKQVERKCSNEKVLEEMILKSDEIDMIDIWNDLKRSKTETNLKYCGGKKKDKEFCFNSTNHPDDLNSFGSSQIKDSYCETDKNVLAQYSVVKKKRCNVEKTEAVSLELSESIRKALQSPLPRGPPPKKPPRTFCHTPHPIQTQAKSRTSTTPPGQVSTKPDIPKLKSKLEKIEKVIKIHETGIQIEKAQENLNKGLHETQKATENHLTEDTADLYQSCLPISNCLNKAAESQNIKKVQKSKSEFYLQLDETDFKASKTSGKNKDCSHGMTNNGTSVKVLSPEVIYDLPYTKKKNSFETFGKCSKDVKESMNSSKAESLHYMCTDLISQSSKHPGSLPKSEEGESEKGSFESEKKFLSIVQKQKSNTLSCVDHSNEVENLGVKDNGEGKSKLSEIKHLMNSLGSEKSRNKLELYFMMDSDCEEVKSTEDAEDEVLSEETAKRKIYISRVSSKLINRAPSWKYRSKNNHKHLFECCLLVGLTLCESKQNMPYIKSIFPPDMKPPPLIEALCFPDASYWPPTSKNQCHEDQYYSLVVTNESGERKFGYCRRVLPEGGHVCLPLAYCIISPHRAGGFFHKILEELESKHGTPGLDKFIKQLYESEFPGPGESLKLKEILEDATGNNHRHDSNLYSISTLVRRPPDVRLEEKDLSQLFQHLELSVFFKVFGSLLHERKVLLLSNSLRTLSSCIEALQSILLPFSWQHTCIPVLPVHLIELCDAPTPYMIGLLKPRNVEKSLTNVNFENGILVDLDDSKILKCCGDEGAILPSRPTRDLKTALNLAMSTSDLLTASVKSVLISDAFIRFFVQIIGNYSDFIQNLPSGEKIFQKEKFIKSATSQTVQSFLDWFTETAMFNSFIQERFQGDVEDVLVRLFRRRALEHLEENSKDSTVVIKNYKVINKKVRTLSDKIKDFTSFNK